MDDKSFFTKETTVTLSQCGEDGCMRISAALDHFMDIASQHSESYGLGADELIGRGLFWLTLHTKAVFRRRPRSGETIRITTWPTQPSGRHCMRYYTIEAGGELLVEGKTRWALMDTGTGRLRKVEEGYPEGIEWRADTVCGGDFRDIGRHFEDAEPLKDFVVLSGDIDIGHHMNNVAYARSLFNCFSSVELKEMNVSQIELSYRSSCYEGETLRWRCRKADGGLEMAALKDDGSAAVLAFIG